MKAIIKAVELRRELARVERTAATLMCEKYATGHGGQYQSCLRLAWQEMNEREYDCGPDARRAWTRGEFPVDVCPACRSRWELLMRRRELRRIKGGVMAAMWRELSALAAEAMP